MVKVRAGDQAIFSVQGGLPSGEGVDGRTRVSGAFPGERVRARLDHVGKHVTFATALELLDGHPARRTIPCTSHAFREGKCSGCALMALEPEAQREWKRELLKEHYGLEVDRVEAAPEQLGYRMSAKRIAFGGPGRLRLGSFVRGTNRPADMAGCLVEHPRIAALARTIVEHAQSLRIGAAFKDAPGLRAVWLRTNGKACLVTLVAAAIDEDDVARLRVSFQRLADRLTDAAGVFWSLQKGEGGDLRGDAAVLLRGEPTLEASDPSALSIGALGFLQPNPTIAERMYAHLLAGIEGGSAFDLYAGSGFTTARLRAQGVEVMPCEIHPEGAAALGVDPMSAEAFLTSATSTPNLVVANPPRRGLGPVVVAELERLGPARIHLMACGPEGLARDLRGLESYEIESLRAFDTLPQTPHCEVIARLVRRDYGDID